MIPASVPHVPPVDSDDAIGLPPMSPCKMRRSQPDAPEFWQGSLHDLLLHGAAAATAAATAATGGDASVSRAEVAAGKRPAVHMMTSAPATIAQAGRPPAFVRDDAGAESFLNALAAAHVSQLHNGGAGSSSSSSGAVATSALSSSGAGGLSVISLESFEAATAAAAAAAAAAASSTGGQVFSGNLGGVHLYGYSSGDGSSGAPTITRAAVVIPGWSVPPRILVVEDDDICRRLSARLLGVFGCTFDFAVDGLDAVRHLEGRKYDLVLMDIMMPKLDGVSATSRIRQFDQLTPIVSMTSNTTESDCITYLAHGMNDVLAKPFNKSSLLEMIVRYCRHLQSVTGGANGIAGAAGLGGMTIERPLMGTVRDEQSQPRIVEMEDDAEMSDPTVSIAP
nr:kinase-regulated stress-responsive transcription factor skn7 [Polyrhizophydium stewartii]